MINITVHYLPFPDECKGTIKGICQQLSADNYLIAIDSTMPEQEQLRTLAHEKAHIYCGHYDSDLPLSVLENEADEISKLCFP